MCEDKLVKKVFNELNVLDTLGFSTWISSVRDLALRYSLDMNEEQTTELFKIECTKIVEKQYVSKWQTEIMDHEKHPILRTYVLYKTVCEMEPHLYLVENPKNRIAISKIRTSSHKLEIERGRYTRPITPIEKRICKVVEDEFHFMLQCYIYTVERDDLFRKIQAVDPLFQDLLPVDKFAYLMTSNDAQMWTWVGNFVHSSFEKREKYMQPWEMIHSVL